MSGQPPNVDTAVERWSAEQIHALAPDTSSLSSARKLATSGGWSDTGYGGTPLSVWGLCQGSGSKPYQTCVDVAEPAYRCSCPSRKFPCKHALALLLRWSAGQLAEVEQPSFVVEWHAGRTNRAQAKVDRAEKAAAPRTPQQERAAARRATQRADRIGDGVEDLTRWLDDQVRQGIAGLDRAGYRHFETVAARLVDAQAPALASAVRRLAPIPVSGPGWEDRLLAEFGLLRLLTTAYAHIDVLPEPLADTVRSRVGAPVAAEQVLAAPAIRDEWIVLGVRDEIDEKLTARRAWLLGRGTGRPALVLSFAGPGQALPVDLVPGTCIDAELCYYPGATPLRALVTRRPGPAARLTAVPPASPIRAGLTQVAGALAGDPWLTRWPLLLDAALAPGQPWRLVDSAGDSLPLDPDAGEPWSLLAASRGHAAPIAVEWSPRGVTPLSLMEVRP